MAALFVGEWGDRSEHEKRPQVNRMTAVPRECEHALILGRVPIMYVKHLTIRNYRNFGDLGFEMELKPFTLIIGENNVGKTNLLNALGLIFSQEIMIFRRRVLDIDDINYATVEAFKEKVRDIEIGTDQIQFPVVSVEVTLTDMDDDQEAVVADWFVNEQLTEAKVTYQFAPAASFDKIAWIKRQRELMNEKKASEDPAWSLIDFPIGDYRYSIFGGDNPSNECNMYLLKMLKMEFLHALRDAQKELIASGEYRLLYRILVQKDKERYDDIKTVLKRLDEVVNKNRNLNSIKADVKKLLDKVSLQSEGSDNSIDFNFSSPEAHELLKKISMIYGANPISVDRNGLGRNNLLYISLILSHLSANHFGEGNTFFRLICIEEPEAHLHPPLQDHLAENTEGIQKDAGKAMQLLLTTHSTHIAAKMSLKNSVVVFNDNVNRPASHYILSGIDETKEKNTIRYLSKHIDATKSRMFFARKVILVEGIAEQLLIPLLFRNNSDNTLEKLGCNIINVHGVAFSHFLKIIRSGFFIKGLVLTDKDTGKQTEERAADLKKEFEKKGLIRIEISQGSTFEKDLIEANKKSEGKEVLLSALKETRPQSGPKYEEGIGKNDLDVESFFLEIEDYKSEFAFNLASQLKEKRKLKAFRIPQYIERGFQFIR
ncbi:MAG: AAA family ATPase [Candidatus Zixiibacteriota bacterium]